MTPAQRFNAWRIVVIGTLAADAIVAPAGSRAAAFAACGLLLAMLGLIVTTPADAIKLPRDRSERVIVGATLAIVALATVRSGRNAAMLGAGMTVVAVALLALCRRFGATPWWIALVSWNPIWLMAIRSS